MEYRPSLHLSVVAFEKGAFGSPSTKFANSTYLLNIIYKYCMKLIFIIFTNPTNISFVVCSVGET